MPGWRAQTLASCTTFLPCVIMPFILLPESARWLLSQGRDEEAMALLRQVAKVNKTSFPSGAVLKPPTSISVQAIEDEQAQQQEQDSDNGGDSDSGRNNNSSVQDQSSLKLLLTHPELRKRQLAMVVAWITCSLLYYGLTSAGSALTDNRHVIPITPPNHLQISVYRCLSPCFR